MKQFLIERGDYVAEFEFDTQEQFDVFLKFCLKECEGDKRILEGILESISKGKQKEVTCFHDYPVLYGFEYRDDLTKKPDDEFREASWVGVKKPYILILTKVYPKSVLDDAPLAFIDKQTNWDKRDKEYPRESVETIQRYLDRAEQIRKRIIKGRQRAPRTKDIDLQLAIDHHLMDRLSQGEAAIKAGVPENALSRGRGKKMLEERVKGVHRPRSIPHQPGVPKKEVEGFHKSETLRQGKKKN